MGVALARCTGPIEAITRTRVTEIHTISTEDGTDMHHQARRRPQVSPTEAAMQVASAAVIIAMTYVWPFVLNRLTGGSITLKTTAYRRFIGKFLMIVYAPLGTLELLGGLSVWLSSAITFLWGAWLYISSWWTQNRDRILNKLRGYKARAAQLKLRSRLTPSPSY